ncbi:MAG: hypothetical protein IT350_16405 [Deltaproteobacteria bacterium]|nr:hypothetical protein [Deltaproteobacteria bacterium]
MRSVSLCAVVGIVVFLLATLVACEFDDGVEIYTEEPGNEPGDDDSDDDIDDDAPDIFSYEIIVHEHHGARTGIATGRFDKPSFEYDLIPVEEKFTHVMSFQVSPMAPPHLGAVASHGPLILYADDGETIVFSPLDQFFESVVNFRRGNIVSGVAGEIDAIPAGWTHRFILARGRGINAAVEYWGDLMRAEHGKARPDRYADVGLGYLGYWTDNGAYYYYQTEPGMNEADTLLAVKDDADTRGIPYGYLQLDSWWYFKVPGLISPGGLIRWEPIPAMFPDGLAAFQDELGLPLVLHNRWFASENDYRDEYEFVEEAEMAMPLSRDVYDEFMANAVNWGAATYEQDWLFAQWDGMSYLREAPGRTAEWMSWIDGAAGDAGLTTQWCMASPGHLLDVVDRSSPTTARTSIDYRRDVSKESFWPQFHTTSMIAWALGVWPFKDNFWTTERAGEAEALISTLSAGMVGVGDRVGEADVEIIGRTCRADGLLLKPDRPAAPIDAMFFDHRRPYTVHTWSDRGKLGRWHYAAAFHLAREHPQRTALDRIWPYVSYGLQDAGSMFVFPEQVTDLHLDLPRELGATGEYVVFDWRSRTAWQPLDVTHWPSIPDLYDFAYFVVAPVWPNGLALIGEVEKFVTVADRRFVSMELAGEAVNVDLAGVPGETVSVWVYDAIAGAMQAPYEATIGGDGKASITVAR